MLKKICNRCGKVLNCDQECECNRKRHKAYDKEQRNKEAATIYQSREWKILTKRCKNKFGGIDWYAWKTKKRIRSGTLSHHIIEVSEDKTKAFDIKNLIYLSEKSHTEIHLLYEKSEEEKKKVQRLLFGFIGGGGGQKSFPEPK